MRRPPVMASTSPATDVRRSRRARCVASPSSRPDCPCRTQRSPAGPPSFGGFRMSVIHAWASSACLTTLPSDRIRTSPRRPLFQRFSIRNTPSGSSISTITDGSPPAWGASARMSRSHAFLSLKNAACKASKNVDLPRSLGAVRTFSPSPMAPISTGAINCRTFSRRIARIFIASPPGRRRRAG